MSGADPATPVLAGMIDMLRGLPQRVDDRVRIDRIRALEELKAAVAAAQAVETAAFAASQRAGQRAVGVPEERVGRGVASQVGLARRVSPSQASRYLGWATILVTELPHTFTALQAGRVSERRAEIVARETIWLSREHRLHVDAELAPRLETLGDRRVEAETKKLGYRLDPDGFVARRARAETERRVWLRPAPDAMVYLSALLPLAQGVASYAALTRTADTTVAGGDERGRGAIMADTLVERVTGQTTASDVPVAIDLIMTDTALLTPDAAGGREPAHLDGHGPIPADLARQLVTGPPDETPMWIRRLYTAPESGHLVAMDSTQRFFTAGQRLFLRLRDQYCRVPWCEALIRHADHIHPAIDGGTTSVDGGQGYCEGCNHAKQAPGWRTRRIDNDDGVHVVETTTPTGHRYRSRAPDPPGAVRPATKPSHRPRHDQPRRTRRRRSGRAEDRVLEVEVRDVPHQLPALFHLRADLLRRLCRLAVARGVLGAEVDGLDVAPVIGVHHEPADDVRPPLLDHRVVPLHERFHPLYVVAATTHDLHESGVIRPATKPFGDRVRVEEVGFAVEVRRDPGEPFALLRPLAVRLGGLSRLETGQRDEPAVLGDSAGGPEPPAGAGTQVLLPTVERGTQTVLVLHLRLDDLNEHV